MNHWNSGVDVQKKARLVSDKLLSTRHSSPAPDVTNVTLPLPTPLTLPLTAGPLLLRLPSLLHLRASLQHFPFFFVLSQHNLDQPGSSPVTIQLLQQRSPRRSSVMESASPLSSHTRTIAPSLTCSPSSGTGATNGSLLHTFFSLAPLVLSCVCIIFLLALSAVCYPVFTKHPFARKSRTGGRHRCRGYSSQLAHRRWAGGRSLCLESFGNRSPARSL